MANAWKREKFNPSTSARTLIVLSITIFVIVLLLFSNPSPKNPNSILRNPTSNLKTLTLKSSNANFHQFNCLASPQPSPVIASIVENLKYPFLYSLSDFGSLPNKPNKNIQRILKGKKFRKPDISGTVQEILEKRKKEEDVNGVVLDVGANVGIATFAAVAMGFRVVAFEPIMENLVRICDGVFLNRAWEMVAVYQAAVSDKVGNVTIHKVIGRLDNSAISATGAKLAFKSNENIAVEVPTVPLDEIISDKEQVTLIKIDVQGWEFHVLRGASKILSRKAGEAPYLIYEEDENLLKASNSSSEEIRKFLHSVGYHECTRRGTDAHCTKNS